MGSEPDDFVEAAKKLVTFGFDVIDINFGCPVKSAVTGCRGGYHLGQPDTRVRDHRKSQRGRARFDSRDPENAWRV